MKHVHKFRRSKVAGRIVRGVVQYTPVLACRCGARKHPGAAKNLPSRR